MGIDSNLEALNSKFTNIISFPVLFTHGIGDCFMGSQNECPASTKSVRREALSIFRELWSEGNSPLHRMYSSWEELENNFEVESTAATNDKTYKTQPCPYCGYKQRISRPLSGIFSYLNCESCKRSFFVETNFKVRKLTDEEKVDIPDALVQIVEDLAKKKVAVVLRLE